MTESPSVEDECEVVADLSLNGMRVFTHVTMEVYRQAALANYAEAEELILRALQLREAGHALLDRASVLAGQYATLEDGYECDCETAFDLDQEDGVPW